MKFQQLLLSPQYKEEETDRVACTLHRIQMALLGISLIILIVRLVVGHVESVLGIGVGIVLLIVTILMNHTGRTRLASLSLILALIGVLSYLLWTGNGIHDIALIGYPLILITAGLLLARRQYAVIACLVVGSAAGIILAEIIGLLQTPVSALTDFSDLIIIPLSLGVIALVVYWLGNSVLLSLTKARLIAEEQEILLGETRRQAARLESLNQVSAAVASGLELEQILDALNLQMRRVTITESFYIALYDEAGRTLSFPIFISRNERVQIPPQDISENGGLAAEVIQSRKTLYLPDVAEPKTWEEHQIIRVGPLDTRSYLGIPLILHGTVIGVMSVQCAAPNAYSLDDISLIETIAAQVAIAIDNARLFNEARESLGREQRLNAFVRTLSETLNLDMLLEKVVLQAADLLEAQAGSICLVSSDGEKIAEVYDLNIPAPLAGARLGSGRGLMWEVIESGQPIHLDDYGRHPGALPALVQAGARGFVSVPLLSGKACIGTLALTRLGDSPRFSERDLELLESIGRQAGVAIQNARLFAALQQELAERSRAENALHQHDAILEAVAYAAEKFLRPPSGVAPDWSLEIQTVLERLGRELRASHAYLLELQLDPAGRQVAAMRYLWSADRHPSRGSGGISPEAGELILHPLVHIDEPAMQDWCELLLSGEPYQINQSQLIGASMSHPFFVMFERAGMRSILNVPVIIEEPQLHNARSLWGVIGFVDTTVEREWSPAEVDALAVATSILSAAIQRQQADEALRESESLYRRAISAADAVPYLQDYASSAYPFMGIGVFQLTGFSSEEMTPELFESLIQEAIPLGDNAGRSHREAIERTRSGQTSMWKADFMIRTRSGEMRWVADTAVELFGPDGRSRGSIGILQDITDRKKVEEEVRNLNAELEQRVRQRTAELEAANRELEAFAYSVSHDLRAPLRGIDGYSKLLIDDFAGRLGDDGLNYLMNVRQATQQMGQLIDDLLKLSRITRAEMRQVDVDLSHLARQIMAALQDDEPKRQVITEIQSGLIVQGDPSLLRLVLENLLRNSWKFTRRTPAARIQLGALPGHRVPLPPSGTMLENRLVYFVCDNGAGFDMRFVYKLFGPFQRLHNPSEFEGTGIGLATVMRIIKRHSGEIWAEGQLDQGATFYFTLP